jgi:regulator of nonsense transcripts 1
MYSNSLVSGLENLFQDLSIESSIESIDSLNKSQKQAVAASLDSSTAMNIVRGPPGTGKTTVIAKTVSIGIKNKLEYIITAQSNAATRNIADSLEKNGVVDYYIIVSDHFYVEVLLFNLSLVA